MISDRDFTNVEVVWEPKEDSGKLTKQFMKKVQEKYGVKISDFWDLHRWSIENIGSFWHEMWHLSGIIYSKPYHQVVDLTVPMGEFQEWFAGAEMNYAENILKYRDNNVAMIVAGEDRQTEKVTYAEMYEKVKLYTAALRSQGVKKNDIVGCFMSNREEAVFAMIAATSMGAVWVGVLPLMGPQAVLNRLSQVNPKILFTIDRFSHNREEIDMIPKLETIASGLSSFEKVVIVASKPDSKFKDISGVRNSCFLHDFLETGRDVDGSVPEMVFEQVPFTHPVFISYTSGTTGLPKVLYHSSGILLGAFRDFWLHNDNEDRNTCWFSMSPVGWATWNMFASMHFLGIRIVLYEGLPYFLTPTLFWDMVDEFEITHLLLVTNILDEMEKRGYTPTERNHLRSLQFMISGGSVVKAKNYDFVYNKIKKDVIFTTTFGATECAGTALVHDQTLKLHKCELPAPCFGIDIQSVDDSGKPVIGAVGEMVFATPFPSLPIGLWGDTDRSLFKKHYCEKYPGKFAIGDLIIINPVTQGIIICGRSDETLKPGGCRFGSSEIYNIVDNFLEIADSICISQYSRKQELERAVLFIKMKGSRALSKDLIERLQTAIAKELSVRHVPEVMLETEDIPRNINGKKLESVVKKVINKMPYNSDTVINPECLKCFADLPELSGY